MVLQGESPQMVMPFRLIRSQSIVFLAPILVCFALSSCERRNDTVDRTFENGIEVVHNRLVPYRVAGEPAELVLDEEFRIDTESAELAAAGLSDIRSFDVDSRGYIYFVQSPRKAEFLLLQFDDRGGLRKAFGRKGQGPGELQWPTLFNVNSRDEFVVWDGLARRLHVYDPDAALIREASGEKSQGGLPLENGSYLVRRSLERPDGGSDGVAVDLVGPDFVTRKTIHTFRSPNRPAPGVRDDAYPPLVVFETTADRIFLGWPETGYEIFVFDLEGRLIRKIRKEFTSIPISPAEKSALLAKVTAGQYPYPEKIIFPASKPPFQYFFADEKGRLFVVTAERDEKTGQNICDIFNRDGLLVGRTPIGWFDIFRQYWELLRLDVVANHGRLYVLREKDSGFKELIVFKAVWR